LDEFNARVLASKTEVDARAFFCWSILFVGGFASIVAPIHARLGFSSVGSASIHGGSKTVRYLLRRLDDYAAVAGGSASTE